MGFALSDAGDSLLLDDGHVSGGIRAFGLLLALLVGVVHRVEDLDCILHENLGRPAVVGGGIKRGGRTVTWIGLYWHWIMMYGIASVLMALDGIGIALHWHFMALVLALDDNGIGVACKALYWIVLAFHGIRWHCIGISWHWTALYWHSMALDGNGVGIGVGIGTKQLHKRRVQKVRSHALPYLDDEDAAEQIRKF